jgi:hypothetical protein
MIVSKPPNAAALLLLIGLAACGGHRQSAQAAAPAAVAQQDPQNPLIGAWHLIGYTPNANMPGVTCETEDMTFNATQTVQVTNGAASTVAVSYIPSAAAVYVITDAGIGNAVKYLFQGPDDMRVDTILSCRYHRVG